MGGKKRAMIQAGEVEDKEEYRVIKVLKPIKYVKLLREVKILNDVMGHRNIVKLTDMPMFLSMFHQITREEYFRTSPHLTYSITFIKYFLVSTLSTHVV